LELWKRFIKYELSNPLNIDDEQTLTSRILFVYKSALLPLIHFPEIWVSLTEYLVSKDKIDEAITQAMISVERNPTSLVLTFNYVELVLERKKNQVNKEDFVIVYGAFDSLLQVLEASVVKVNENFDRERDALIGDEENVDDNADQDGFFLLDDV
jgi:cleavage stimulation factor subunit 3